MPARRHTQPVSTGTTRVVLLTRLVSLRLPIGLAVGLAAALAFAAGLGTQRTLADEPGAALDAGPAGQYVSASQVLDALAAAGLAVYDVTPETLQSSPSSPPAAEREAVHFTVLADDPAADHPLTGRVMVFADAEHLNQKADWFRRAGVPVVQHRNALLWLDGDLNPQVADGYRQALVGMP